MNKSAIQRFAIWARTELIDRVSQRAYQYDITKDGYGDANAETASGRPLTPDEQRQRRELVEQIRQKGYAQVMEEVAYTWFNRFIALRFMEVNNYLPSHTRVFSDSTGAFKPEILEEAMHLDLPGLERDKVLTLLERNQTEDLYRYLLLTQCNALNEALPNMFERMGGYTELLLPSNILRQDSVLGRMVTDIPEEDWRDAVQIIGWLYQYYNTELKDDTFAQLKKNVKITKERIPAATQLFTPDWIVRYMVENSLGRLWLEGHPNAELRGGWKYYLDEAEQEPEVEAQLVKLREEYKTIKPEEIKVIDPCMGSGHILVYAFDVLMQIYTSAGWDQREAAQSILKNNLYGLDIDDRAAQLAYFAVMMKARQYDRRLLTRGIQPHIYAFAESNTITTAPLHDMGITLSQDEYGTAVKQVLRLLDELRDAKEYGSILTVTPCDWDLLRRFAVPRTEDEGGQQLLGIHGEQIAAPLLQKLINIGEALSQKYDVVVTNPPYMAVSNAGAKVNDYVKKNFLDSKADMFAVFIERCGQMTRKDGYQAMITQHAWMFLSSFEKLRTKLLAVDIVNMAHLGARAFEEIGGEVVQTTSFVIRKSHIADYKGEYCRLIEPTSQQGKEDMFLAGENRYAADQSNFSKIPGSPVAYWVSDTFILTFANSPVDNYAFGRQGMTTTDNLKYLRRWQEVSIKNIGFNVHSREESILRRTTWFPYNKGGQYRKWFGNNEYVVFYYNDGKELIDLVTKKYPRISDPEFIIKNRNCYFKEGIEWSDLTTGNFGARRVMGGFIFDACSPTLFITGQCSYNYLLGMMNTVVFQKYMNILSPTMHYNICNVVQVPLLKAHESKVEETVHECIAESQDDWNSYETSWDFKRNPLV